MLGALAGVILLIVIFGIRFNASDSLPTGFYRIVSNGQYVMFCLDGSAGKLGLARGYREGSFACQDGGSPLMKEPVAGPGDEVQMGPEGITVNGHLLPNTAPREKDTQGRPLTPYPFGRYVCDECVWTVSTYNPRSFDSRYFGPVKQSEIRARLNPLWLF